MNLKSIQQRTARLLAEAKEHEEAPQVQVIFYMPDIDGEPIPSDAPPLEANGMRAYRVYLPVKQELSRGAEE